MDKETTYKFKSAATKAPRKCVCGAKLKKPVYDVVAYTAIYAGTRYYINHNKRWHIPECPKCLRIWVWSHPDQYVAHFTSHIKHVMRIYNNLHG